MKNKIILTTIFCVISTLIISTSNANNIKVSVRDTNIINYTTEILKLISIEPYNDDTVFSHPSVGDKLSANGGLSTNIHMSNGSVWPAQGVGYALTYASDDGSTVCGFKYDDPAFGDTHLINVVNKNCYETLTAADNVILTSK